MEINQTTLGEFRRDFMEAMKPLQEKYDVTISIGRITYEKERFSSKLSVNNGRERSRIEENAFNADVWRYEHLGLKEGMYNRVFMGIDGRKYVLRGFHTRAAKYPLIVFDYQSGNTIRVPEFFIKELLDEYYAENHIGKAKNL